MYSINQFTTSTVNTLSLTHHRCTNLDEQVGVKDHQIGGHLSRDLNLLGLQLCVHAEQHVMGISIIPCRSNKNKKHNIWLTYMYRMTITERRIVISRLHFALCLYLHTALLWRWWWQCEQPLCTAAVPYTNGTGTWHPGRRREEKPTESL